VCIFVFLPAASLPRRLTRGENARPPSRRVDDDACVVRASKLFFGPRSGRPPLTSLENMHRRRTRPTQHHPLSLSLSRHLKYYTAKHLYDAGTGASIALELASLWSAGLHLILAISGTFVLKRFSTAFTIGCFLGLTVVISQQDLLLFAAFYHYKHGDVVCNVIFADLAFALFAILTFFSLILGHFRHYIIVK